MSTGIALLILAFMMALLGYKFIHREEKEDKICGIIYVYQDETGEWQLYLEPAITPKEMGLKEEVCFKVSNLCLYTQPPTRK